MKRTSNMINSFTKQYTKILHIASCIILHEGLILMLNRSPHLSYANNAEFPGGKIDEGESIITGVCREVWEETGIELKSLSRIVDVINITTPKGKYRKINFLANTESFKVRLSSEHSSYMWVSANEYNNLRISEFNKNTINALFTKYIQL